MSAPLVSVWMITYNHEEFIAKAIESVIMQDTDFEFEIVIGEDCSTDSTRQICIDYQKRFPSLIRLITSESNVGFAVNGVRTFKACKGKYIALLEGDDYWTDPRKLQKQVSILEHHPEFVACHHWQKIAVTNDGVNYEEKDAPTDGHGYFPNTIGSVKDIFENNLRLKSRTIMFRNIFLNGFLLPDWFYKVPFLDVPLTMMLGKFGDFYFINEKMAVYRMTGSGVSSNGKGSPLFVFKHFCSWIEIWEYANKWYERKFEKETINTINHFYTFIVNYYKGRIVKKTLVYLIFRSQLSAFQRLRLAGKVIRKSARLRFK